VNLKIDRSSTLTSLLLWVGVLGAPIAWTAQLVIGYGAEEADCSRGGGSFDSAHPLDVALSVGAGVVSVASLLVAFGLWRRTRDRDVDGRGRVTFMAVSGILLSLLFLALITVTAIGTTHFDPCTAG
jgi:hypothetical protein